MFFFPRLSFFNHINNPKRIHSLFPSFNYASAHRSRSHICERNPVRRASHPDRISRGQIPLYRRWKQILHQGCRIPGAGCAPPPSSLPHIASSLSLGQVTTTTNNPFGEPSTYIDPLFNGTTCQRDLPYLQQLGINTIRAYSVDSTLNHDACMQLFSGAGIYTM